MEELSALEIDLKLVNSLASHNDDKKAVSVNSKGLKNKIDWLRNDLVSLLDD